MLTPILIFSLFILIPVALIVFGLKKTDWPNSGTLVILGFIFLALSAAHAFTGLITKFYNAGFIDSDQYHKLNPESGYGILLLPVPFLLVLGFTGLLSKRPDSRSFVKWGFIGALIALLLAGFAAPSYQTSDQRNESITKSNTFSIQAALIKYAADKGLYPDNIEILTSTGYLEEFPLNAFTKQPMENIPYSTPKSYGNFTYLPLTVGNEVRGYYLIAYGYGRDADFRILSQLRDDHVIRVLDSKHDDNPLWPSDVPFPDIKTVIESTQK